MAATKTTPSLSVSPPPPPLTWKRCVFEIITTAAVLTIASSFHCFGWIGFVAHTVFLGWGSIVWDWHIGPTMENNLERLAMVGGYPKWSMWLLMAFNLVSSNCLVTAICWNFDCFKAPMRFDFFLLLELVLGFGLAELAFTTSHYLLHQTKIGASWHHLHHLW